MQRWHHSSATNVAQSLTPLQHDTQFSGNTVTSKSQFFCILKENPEAVHTTQTRHTIQSQQRHISIFFFLHSIRKPRFIPTARLQVTVTAKTQKGIPESRRPLVKVRTHPAHALPSLVLSKRVTPSHQQQGQPRQHMSEATILATHLVRASLEHKAASSSWWGRQQREGRHHSWLGPGGWLWLECGWQPLEPTTSMRCCLCMCAS